MDRPTTVASTAVGAELDIVEDVIEGFCIVSFKSLEDLEVCVCVCAVSF